MRESKTNLSTSRFSEMEAECDMKRRVAGMSSRASDAMVMRGRGTKTSLSFLGDDKFSKMASGAKTERRQRKKLPSNPGYLKATTTSKIRKMEARKKRS